ncbi:hypothetical protein [Brevundimonas sp. M20]|uniref:hypothetical protein n=1 Tax=Brevundimonas sp. M20 TaxID=2591463 RepID=UPI00114660AD|nr:hypothetical protein [Brevundimonas sp. M20]QDH73760.1 hypothetical protein FKQ52_10185 [Brevundimonas sp. M20]
MISLLLAAALLLAGQDAPAARTPPHPDAIAAKVTGEPDPCARRATIIDQYVADQARSLETTDPEQLSALRRLAVDMYQNSHDMARPRGAPEVDFRALCDARPQADQARPPAR